jgi:hypothetical protein
MNEAARRRLLPVAMVAALGLADCACEKKKEPAPAQEVVIRDLAAPAAPTSETVLRKTFVLKSLTTFPFEVPPRVVRPHLHGIFASFIREVHVAGDDAANVDFLILDADQYASLIANRPSEALFSVEASHNQSVNLDLPASLTQPVKYYLIFRNSGKNSPKTVEAEFHVDF